MKMLNKIIGSSIAVAAVLTFSTSTSQAQPNLLVNPGFDFGGIGGAAGASYDPTLNTGGWTVNPITLTSGPAGGSGVDQGWALFGGDAGATAKQSDMWNDPVLTDNPLSPLTTLLETAMPGNNWGPAGAFQIISGITPGQTYKFGVWVLSDTVENFATGILVQLGFEQPALGTPSTVENPGHNVGISAATAPTLHNWTYYSVQATAPAGYTDAIVYLMFQDNSHAIIPEDMYFDNASLTVVPEPSTLALLGLAVPFYLIRRRKS